MPACPPGHWNRLRDARWLAAAGDRAGAGGTTPPWPLARAYTGNARSSWTVISLVTSLTRVSRVRAGLRRHRPAGRPPGAGPGTPTGRRPSPRPPATRGDELVEHGGQRRALAGEHGQVTLGPGKRDRLGQRGERAGLVAARGQRPCPQGHQLDQGAGALLGCRRSPRPFQQPARLFRQSRQGTGTSAVVCSGPPSGARHHEKLAHRTGDCCSPGTGGWGGWAASGGLGSWQRQYGAGQLLHLLFLTGLPGRSVMPL
jgi:hypothetical protein